MARKSSQRDSRRNNSSNSNRRNYDNPASLKEFKPSTIETTAFINPVNEKQRRFVEAIKRNDIVLGLGSAGSGKSLLALHTAIQLINNPNSPIERIVYVRANIDTYGEKSIGAIPGEVNDKLIPSLGMPVYDNLSEFMQKGHIEALFEYEKVIITPLQFLRGRSFSNSFIIFDECQDSIKQGLLKVLTRISHGSKLVLLGDPAQSDLGYTNTLLTEVALRLQGVPGIGSIFFDKSDIVRHPLLGEILTRLEGL